MKKQAQLIAGTLLVGASYLAFINNEIDKFFKRSKIGVDELSYLNDDEVRKQAEINRPIYREWFLDSKKDELYIRSYDGLKLHGYVINNLNTDKYIIFSHGLNASLESSLILAYNFEKLGYNSIIYDQRACGESDGTYSTLGFKESLDLIQWINELITIKPNSSICLHGISMGAISICMALSSKLPSNVKCCIADCGFTTLKEEIKYRITEKYHLPSEPFLTTSNLIINKKLGFSFKDLRPIDHLKNNTLPICFVHGLNDRVVPFEMSKKLYMANKNGIRKYYPVKEKGHGQSKYDPNYYTNLNIFIKENL